MADVPENTLLVKTTLEGVDQIRGLDVFGKSVRFPADSFIGAPIPIENVDFDGSTVTSITHNLNKLALEAYYEDPVSKYIMKLQVVNTGDRMTMGLFSGEVLTGITVFVTFIKE